MFRITELLKQDTDAKFLDLFWKMNQKDFFFTTPQSCLSWTNRLTSYSSSRLSEIELYLRNQQNLAETFAEMKKFCDVNYIKEIRSEIKASYDKWNSTMYNSKYITLRYVILATEKIALFESVFEDQRRNLFLESSTPNEIMIVAGNPIFYICKQYNNTVKFDFQTIKNLNKFRLECLLDVPFSQNYFRYNGSESNPAYGKYMDQTHLRISDLPYLFLKQYNLEKMLETPLPKQEPKQERDEQERDEQESDEENSDSD